MNTKLIARATIAVFLIALGGVAAAGAPDPAPVMPERPAPRDPMAPQAADEQPGAEAPRLPEVAVTPVLQYQGRLTNPTTGQPVPDGVLAMTFRLYTAASGGSAVWQEVKNVQVSGGLFSTGLGDTTALPQSLFNGQALWLGVKVGADLEAIPRQPLMPVAYAIGLLPGAIISASSAAPALEVANLSTGVRVTSTTGIGLRGETASILAGRAGVLGLAGEPPIDPPDEAGVLGKSTDGVGVAGLSLNDVGSYGYSVNGDGVWGNASAPGGAGVYGSHFGNGWGGYFFSANGTGLAANSTTGYGAFFGSGTGQALYANGSVTVTGDLYLSGSILPPKPRTISMAANALNYKTGAVIRQDYAGLLWGPSFTEAAFVMLQRPDDWDGVSDVILRLIFYPTTASAGSVSFFIRPRAYNPGDVFWDAASLTGDAVPVGTASQIREQLFTIPAGAFGAKPFWVISIQNIGVGSTYPDDVMLMSVALTYNAVR